MNPDPDYSAAYVILKTSDPHGLEGHGLTFTIGRGNELCVAAVEALAPFVIGCTLESIAADMGAFWRRIVGDSQLRWVGPEKGVIHLATAALVNAVWDLWAKVESKPLWRLLADMTPEEIVMSFGLNTQVQITEPIKTTHRIVMNFYTAKRLFHLLGQVIAQHEAAFGPLELDANRRVRAVPRPSTPPSTLKPGPA